MKRRMDHWSKARRSRGSVASPSEAGYLANVRPCWGEATVRFQVAPSEWRGEMTEDNSLDVQLSESFHRVPRGCVVIAVEPAGKRYAPKSSLERVTHENHAIPGTVQTDTPRVWPGV